MSEINENRIREIAKEEISHLEKRLLDKIDYLTTAIEKVPVAMNNLTSELKQFAEEKVAIAFKDHSRDCKEIRKQENKDDIKEYIKYELFNKDKNFIADDLGWVVDESSKRKVSRGLFNIGENAMSKVAVSILALILMSYLFHSCPNLKSMRSYVYSKPAKVEAKK